MEINITIKIEESELNKLLGGGKEPLKVSEHAKFFDGCCYGYNRHSKYMNYEFLRIQELRANEMLKKNGHLFLNEVYDMLGMPRTMQGQSAGWLYPNSKVRFLYVDEIWDRILLDFNATNILK